MILETISSVTVDAGGEISDDGWLPPTDEDEGEEPEDTRLRVFYLGTLHEGDSRAFHCLVVPEYAASGLSGKAAQIMYFSTHLTEFKQKIWDDAEFRRKNDHLCVYDGLIEEEETLPFTGNFPWTIFPSSFADDLEHVVETAKSSGSRKRDAVLHTFYETIRDTCPDNVAAQIREGTVDVL